MIDPAFADYESSAAPVSGAPRISIVVPTANRPAHLYRLLRYYADQLGAAAVPIIVADSSTAEHAAAFDSLNLGIVPGLTYRLMRHDPATAFFDKLRAALRTVTTEFVMLAADDDFYFPDWLEGAVAHLDRDREATAVIGNYFVFGLSGFTAFSREVEVWDGGPERFSIPWLEGKSSEERVREIGRNPHGIQTIGWYALHRTDILRRIIEHVAERDLPLLLAERLFTVVQAATGKTHFTPEIFLARQADADPAHFHWRAEPMGYAANEAAIESTRAGARDYLVDVLRLNEADARTLVDDAFGFAIAMMRQADRRRLPRRLLRASGLSRLLARSRAAEAPPPRDPRLPAACDPDEMARKAEIVRFACLSDEDRALHAAEPPAGDQYRGAMA